MLSMASNSMAFSRSRPVVSGIFWMVWISTETASTMIALFWKMQPRLSIPSRFVRRTITRRLRIRQVQPIVTELMSQMVSLRTPQLARTIMSAIQPHWLRIISMPATVMGRALRPAGTMAILRAFCRMISPFNATSRFAKATLWTSVRRCSTSSITPIPGFLT